MLFLYFQLTEYFFKHQLPALQHIVIPESQYPETLRLQMLKVYDCVSVEITPVEVVP